MHFIYLFRSLITFGHICFLVGAIAFFFQLEGLVNLLEISATYSDGVTGRGRAAWVGLICFVLPTLLFTILYSAFTIQQLRIGLEGRPRRSTRVKTLALKRMLTSRQANRDAAKSVQVSQPESPPGSLQAEL